MINEKENNDSLRQRQKQLSDDQEGTDASNHRSEEGASDVERQQPEPQQDKPKLKTNTKKAVIFASLFALNLFFYQAVAKVTMETGVKVLDLSLIRVLAILLQSSITVNCLGLSLDVPEDLKAAVYLRCTIGMLSFVGVGYGIYLMPLMYNQILFNLAPFWLFILAYFVLGEKMTPFQIVALVLCFACIVVMSVAKPVEQDPAESKFTYTSQSKALGTVVMLIASLFYAWSSLITRMVQRVHPTVLMFYYGLIGVVLLSIALIIQALIRWKWFFFVDYTAKQWGLLTLMATLNTLGINFQTRAMQNENPAFISLIGYSGVFYAFLGDILFFKVQFSAQELICSILLIVLTTSVIVLKLKKAREEAKKQKDQLEPLISEKKVDDFVQ